MADQKYKPGDLVELKSGGPKMVVELYQDSIKRYRCTWFSGAKHNSELFKEEALVSHEEKNNDA